jgi:hypothetical protein
MTIYGSDDEASIYIDAESEGKTCFCFRPFTLKQKHEERCFHCQSTAVYSFGYFYKFQLI